MLPFGFVWAWATPTMGSALAVAVSAAPTLTPKVFQEIGAVDLTCIGVSSRPRVFGVGR